MIAFSSFPSYSFSALIAFFSFHILMVLLSKVLELWRWVVVCDDGRIPGKAPGEVGAGAVNLLRQGCCCLEACPRCGFLLSFIVDI